MPGTGVVSAAPHRARRGMGFPSPAGDGETAGVTTFEIRAARSEDGSGVAVMVGQGVSPLGKTSCSLAAPGSTSVVAATTGASAADLEGEVPALHHGIFELRLLNQARAIRQKPCSRQTPSKPI